MSKLKIRKLGVFTPGSNTTSVGIICDNSDTDTDNNCPSATHKDYKIVAKSDGTASWAIQEVDKSDSTNCKTLLSPASTSGTGATTDSTTGAGTSEEVANIDFRILDITFSIGELLSLL